MLFRDWVGLVDLVVWFELGCVLDCDWVCICACGFGWLRVCGSLGGLSCSGVVF